MKLKYLLLLYSIFSISSLIRPNPNAFCSVPVADLVGTSMKQAKQKKLPIQSYEDLPLGDNPGDFVCPRLSQLIFNEPVQILEKDKNEYKIKIFHWYHQTGKLTQKQDTYWVSKSAITRFSDLPAESKKKLPQPILFEDNAIPQKDIVTLTEAFFDKPTGRTFSAGTRFLKTDQKEKKNQFSVFIYDNPSRNFKAAYIPCSLAIDRYPKTDKEKRKLFVKLLKQWAHPQKGYISYVFGGGSIGSTTVEKPIIKKLNYKKRVVTLYDLPERVGAKQGIDCAHLIARAAQIAGIKLFGKNTTALKRILEPLRADEKIRVGDILIWNGHTAVISDTKKGLLIEARGYYDKYGRVQQIPFSEQFEGIKTTEQLKTAYLQTTPIKRRNKTGKSVQTIYDLTIMKLPLL